jgi:exonuclease III
MKLISLNIWGGIVYEPLINFIKNHSEDTDIFCFQEVLFGDTPDFTEINKGRINIFKEISDILSDFDSVKRITIVDHLNSEPIDFSGGQAIFIRKNIKIRDMGEMYCYDKLPHNTNKGGKWTGSVQWIEFSLNDSNFIISNLHGLWQQDTFGADTPERLTQSKKIKDFLNTKHGKKIICGDFNLNPHGNSISILEEGMINLININNINLTRSSFYLKQNKCSDYILISPDIQIKDFKLLKDEVSDHLPLFLDFS